MARAIGHLGESPRSDVGSFADEAIAIDQAL